MSISIFIIKAIQFILSLSVIVVIHELGHFLGAKLCKTRVEKFYLFFNPWFSLFKKKYKDTEYGIGWLPLGGFVKIAGMIDESMDKTQLAKPAESWEYRSKKPWQKLIMITGGVIFNFLLSWSIYTFMITAWGQTYISPQNLPYGIVTDSAAQSIGLQDGDMILELDGEVVKNFSALPIDIISGGEVLLVERNNKKLSINIPEDFGAEIINSKKINFIGIRMLNNTIDSIIPNSVASQIGLQTGDLICAVDTKPINYWHELQQSIRYHQDKPMNLTIKRGEQELSIPNVRLQNDKSLGIFNQAPDNEKLYTTEAYSFFAAIPAGFSKCIHVLGSYWEQLKIIFGGKINVNENLGGFISMGKIFPAEWSLKQFWGLTAFLSLIIGILNILPIPALDGGHAVIIIIEWITGKTLPLKVLETIQKIGIALLIGLMLYTQGLDILRLFK